MQKFKFTTQRVHRSVYYSSAILVAFFMLSSLAPSFAATATSDFFDMSLSELLNTEVTSVSKTSENKKSAAAAIYVITSDDIQRSGANSVPDLLRTVPGINVARIDSSKWSITARGFGGAFANKLLVLIDGRSVYTPFFSGVYWDMQDVMLEDVDRIEIIRGPGGTMWGANAVNGVINIVTKRASETQGGLFTAGVGSEEKAFSSIRYGWSNENSDTFYRLYGKGLSRDSGEEIAGNGQADDDWDYGRLGFRMDKTFSNEDTLTLQGDFLNIESNTVYSLYDTMDMSSFLLSGGTSTTGVNALGQWSRTLTSGSTIQLKGFLDYYDRDDPVHEEERATWDIEFQHSTELNDTHQIVWGAGYRGSRSDHGNTEYIAVTPSSDTHHVFNVFFQDQINISDTLRLTLGTKLEHNSYSGFEVQPNIRLAWTPNERYTLWGAVSRAVRTPNESEQHLSPLSVLDSSGAFVYVYGDDDSKSEELISYEAGVRTELTTSTALDVSIYYNDYDKVRSVELDPSITPPTPAPAVIIDNDGKAEIFGLETVFDWKINDRWSSQFVYSFAHGHFNSEVPSQDRNTPEQQVSIKNYISLSDSWELDAAIRYVDRMSAIGIDDYVTADVRLAWTPTDDLTLELIGRDLFGPSRTEYVESLVQYVSSQVERGVYGKITWKF